MARGLFRIPSIRKALAAYRSQIKRFWMKVFTLGRYGKKGAGWIIDPEKARYNFWYNRTSINLLRFFGIKPSRLSSIYTMLFLSSEIDYDGNTEIKQSKKNRNNNKTANRQIDKNSLLTANNQTAKTYPLKTPDPQNKSDSIKEDLSEVQQSITCYSLSQPDNSEQFPLLQKEDKFILDENTPKSTPKNMKDQYIKKRMYIANVSLCDQTVLLKLTVGTYFDLVPEDSDLHGTETIKLVFEDQKIGNVEKRDCFMLNTCLRLKRRIYGVITDIDRESDTPRYEYETWFDFE